MNNLFSNSNSRSGSGEQAATVEYHQVNMDKLMDDVKSVTDELNEDVGSGMNAADVALALQKAKLIKVTLETKLIKDQLDRLNRLNGNFFRFVIVAGTIIPIIMILVMRYGTIY